MGVHAPIRRVRGWGVIVTGLHHQWIHKSSQPRVVVMTVTLHMTWIRVV